MIPDALQRLRDEILDAGKNESLYRAAWIGRCSDWAIRIDAVLATVPGEEPEPPKVVMNIPSDPHATASVYVDTSATVEARVPHEPPKEKCENCGHDAPHTGPSAGGGADDPYDGCTHPNCICGYDSRLRPAEGRAPEPPLSRVDQLIRDEDAALEASPAPPIEQFVWLVERIQQLQINGKATYWTGYTADQDKNLPEVETNNSWDACWFARQQDAMRVALLVFGKPLARAGWQIVEHGFTSAAQASPAPGGQGVRVFRLRRRGTRPAPPLDWQKITRVEVIGEQGRLFTAIQLGSVEPSIQDQGRTLKLFIARPDLPAAVPDVKEKP